MNLFKKKNNNEKKVFVIAGGVASNNKIRKKLTDLSVKNNFEPIFPPKNLCSDNAAMIAMVGLEKYRLGLTSQVDFPARPRWPLDESAIFLKGAGVKL
jgi:N6-L-threonylcarbamoyladenine synthase